MQTFQGRIRLSGARQGSDSDKFVFIDLVDDSSGMRLIEIKIPKSAAAEVFFANQEVQCSYDWNEKCLMGHREEHKVEKVFVQKGHSCRDEKVAAKLVKHFEKDGWKANLRDLNNPHRWSCEAEGGGHYVSVGFVRYIKP